jgi:hypothetical protein
MTMCSLLFLSPTPAFSEPLYTHYSLFLNLQPTIFKILTHKKNALLQLVYREMKYFKLLHVLFCLLCGGGATGYEVTVGDQDPHNKAGNQEIEG